MVRPEQALGALVLFGHAPVGVAAQLVDGGGERVGDGRALGLDHHQRDAVHEQHDVRHDEPAVADGAGRVHAELVHRDELVLVVRLEADEADAALVLAIGARDVDAADDLVVQLLVDRDEVLRGRPFELRDRLVDAAVVEPFGAVVVAVQAAQPASSRSRSSVC